MGNKHLESELNFGEIYCAQKHSLIPAVLVVFHREMYLFLKILDIQEFLQEIEQCFFSLTIRIVLPLSIFHVEILSHCFLSYPLYSWKNGFAAGFYV